MSGYSAARARTKERADRHLLRRAEQLQSITVELQGASPRDGENLNRFGQRRSSPGSPPATETGNLQRLLQQPPVMTDRGPSIIVNYKVQELGSLSHGLLPRPLARESIDILKAQVRS